MVPAPRVVTWDDGFPAWDKVPHVVLLEMVIPSHMCRIFYYVMARIHISSKIAAVSWTSVRRYRDLVE
jgi:hypothetical protein